MDDVEYFLKLTGIPGESRDSKHRDEIDVRSWSWGLARPAGSGSGGGSTGRPVVQDLAIVKVVDRSSPRLAEACATGKHLQQAVLSARRAGGAKFTHDFLVVTLSDVTISSFQEAAGDAELLPLDSVSIDFSKIEYAYSTQKADGTVDAPITWTGDLKAGR